MAQDDEAHRDLIATLEACGERLNGIQKEAGLAAALLEMAVVTLRQSSDAGPMEERLEALLQRHHDRIASTVIAALRSESPADAAFPFRMDPDARSARIGRRRIPLTESEYKVLELLWEQMPAPVSRATLLEHLYGPDHGHTETVIDMFILRIRQKLRNAGCIDASIVAVRGLGWILDLGPVEAKAETDQADGIDVP